MKLYNTLTRAIETITPLHAPHVGVYTCGPTVYDYAHVGHWFNYVRMDMLIRTLKAAGYDVTWVMNITDVGHLTSDADEGEDKLEKGAKREGKTAWEVASFYTDEFLQSMTLLTIQTPDHIVKATDHITEQIQLIQILETKGYTYRIDDGIYYDTSKFEGYASFARLDVGSQEAGKRVQFNPQKRNSSDFALWKFSPKESKRDMEWDSPWGTGFPGWHIECSAMSMKYLGATLDIHTGGIDHIPVHHTNEIAQSEAATGKRFANYWFHSNHVLAEGEKISKSLGNGLRLQQIIEHGIRPEVLRLHILESHYRSQSRFSWEALEAAQNRLRDFEAMAALRFQTQDITHDAGTFSIDDVKVELQRCLEEDINTPQALAYLSSVSTQLQAVLIETNMSDEFEAMLQAVDDLLGLRLSDTEDITDQQKSMIAERQTARSSKDWQKADERRQRLTEQGIGLRDVEQGSIATTIWYRL
jgi:cysteinyl-tRNA synthetase